MNNRPAGSELLTIARRTLLDDLLPALPKDQHYSALMVANAMAIALRELQAAEQQPTGVPAELQRFLDDIGAPDSASSQDGEQVLARFIRERRIAQEHMPRLHELLLSVTQGKLALSNPKYLSAS
ncbi:MAG: DUF6285 domain-containing protein [Burkholderiaceae bacterium]